MPDPLDVLSLDEGRSAINTSSTDHDAELAGQITAVSRILDAECGAIVQRDITAEVHDGGWPSVTVRWWPVVSFDAVASDAAAVTGYDREPYDRDAALWSGRLEKTGGFPTGRWNLTVSYTAGRYETTADVDPRFKTAAASILRRLWKRESGTWAQSSDFFETLDRYELQSTATSGFYRVARPIIDELLADEIGRYSYARAKHYGLA